MPDGGGSGDGGSDGEGGWNEVLRGGRVMRAAVVPPQVWNDCPFLPRCGSLPRMLLELLGKAALGGDPSIPSVLYSRAFCTDLRERRPGLLAFLRSVARENSLIPIAGNQRQCLYIAVTVILALAGVTCAVDAVSGGMNGIAVFVERLRVLVAQLRQKQAEAPRVADEATDDKALTRILTFALEKDAGSLDGGVAEAHALLDHFRVLVGSINYVDGVDGDQLIGGGHVLTGVTLVFTPDHFDIAIDLCASNHVVAVRAIKIAAGASGGATAGAVEAAIALLDKEVARLAFDAERLAAEQRDTAAKAAAEEMKRTLARREADTADDLAAALADSKATEDERLRAAAADAALLAAVLARSAAEAAAAAEEARARLADEEAPAAGAVAAAAAAPAAAEEVQAALEDATATAAAERARLADESLAAGAVAAAAAAAAEEERAALEDATATAAAERCRLAEEARKARKCLSAATEAHAAAAASARSLFVAANAAAAASLRRARKAERARHAAVAAAGRCAAATLAADVERVRARAAAPALSDVARAAAVAAAGAPDAANATRMAAAAPLSASALAPPSRVAAARAVEMRAVAARTVAEGHLVRFVGSVLAEAEQLPPPFQPLWLPELYHLVVRPVSVLLAIDLRRSTDSLPELSAALDDFALAAAAAAAARWERAAAATEEAAERKTVAERAAADARALDLQREAERAAEEREVAATTAANKQALILERKALEAERVARQAAAAAAISAASAALAEAAAAAAAGTAATLSANLGELRAVAARTYAAAAAEATSTAAAADTSKQAARLAKAAVALVQRRADMLLNPPPREEVRQLTPKQVAADIAAATAVRERAQRWVKAAREARRKQRTSDCQRRAKCSGSCGERRRRRSLYGGWCGPSLFAKFEELRRHRLYAAGAAARATAADEAAASEAAAKAVGCGAAAAAAAAEGEVAVETPPPPPPPLLSAVASASAAAGAVTADSGSAPAAAVDTEPSAASAGADGTSAAEAASAADSASAAASSSAKHRAASAKAARGARPRRGWGAYFRACVASAHTGSRAPLAELVRELLSRFGAQEAARLPPPLTFLIVRAAGDAGDAAAVAPLQPAAPAASSLDVPPVAGGGGGGGGFPAPDPATQAPTPPSAVPAPAATCIAAVADLTVYVARSAPGARVPVGPPRPAAGCASPEVVLDGSPVLCVSAAGVASPSLYAAPGGADLCPLTASVEAVDACSPALDCDKSAACAALYALAALLGGGRPGSLGVAFLRGAAAVLAQVGVRLLLADAGVTRALLARAEQLPGVAATPAVLRVEPVPAGAPPGTLPHVVYDAQASAAVDVTQDLAVVPPDLDSKYAGVAVLTLKHESKLGLASTYAPEHGVAAFVKLADAERAAQGGVARGVAGVRVVVDAMTALVAIVGRNPDHFDLDKDGATSVAKLAVELVAALPKAFGGARVLVVAEGKSAPGKRAWLKAAHAAGAVSRRSAIRELFRMVHALTKGGGDDDNDGSSGSEDAGSEDAGSDAGGGAGAPKVEVLFAAAEAEVECASQARSSGVAFRDDASATVDLVATADSDAHPLCAAAGVGYFLRLPPGGGWLVEKGRNLQLVSTQKLRGALGLRADDGDGGDAGGGGGAGGGGLVNAAACALWSTCNACDYRRRTMPKEVLAALAQDSGGGEAGGGAHAAEPPLFFPESDWEALRSAAQRAADGASAGDGAGAGAGAAGGDVVTDVLSAMHSFAAQLVRAAAPGDGQARFAPFINGTPDLRDLVMASPEQWPGVADGSVDAVTLEAATSYTADGVRKLAESGKTGGLKRLVSPWASKRGSAASVTKAFIKAKDDITKHLVKATLAARKELATPDYIAAAKRASKPTAEEAEVDANAMQRARTAAEADAPKRKERAQPAWTKVRALKKDALNTLIFAAVSTAFAALAAAEAAAPEQAAAKALLARLQAAQAAARDELAVLGRPAAPGASSSVPITASDLSAAGTALLPLRNVVIGSDYPGMLAGFGVEAALCGLHGDGPFATSVRACLSQLNCIHADPESINDAHLVRSGGRRALPSLAASLASQSRTYDALLFCGLKQADTPPLAVLVASISRSAPSLEAAMPKGCAYAGPAGDARVDADVAAAVNALKLAATGERVVTAAPARAAANFRLDALGGLTVHVSLCAAMTHFTAFSTAAYTSGNFGSARTKAVAGARDAAQLMAALTGRAPVVGAADDIGERAHAAMSSNGTQSSGERYYMHAEEAANACRAELRAMGGGGNQAARRSALELNARRLEADVAAYKKKVADAGGGGAGAAATRSERADAGTAYNFALPSLLKSGVLHEAVDGAAATAMDTDSADEDKGGLRLSGAPVLGLAALAGAEVAAAASSAVDGAGDPAGDTDDGHAGDAEEANTGDADAGADTRELQHKLERLICRDPALFPDLVALRAVAAGLKHESALCSSEQSKALQRWYAQRGAGFRDKLLALAPATLPFREREQRFCRNLYDWHTRRGGDDAKFLTFARVSMGHMHRDMGEAADALINALADHGVTGDALARVMATDGFWAATAGDDVAAKARVANIKTLVAALAVHKVTGDALARVMAAGGFWSATKGGGAAVAARVSNVNTLIDVLVRHGVKGYSLVSLVSKNPFWSMTATASNAAATRAANLVKFFSALDATDIPAAFFSVELLCAVLSSTKPGREVKLDRLIAATRESHAKRPKKRKRPRGTSSDAAAVPKPKRPRANQASTAAPPPQPPQLFSRSGRLWKPTARAAAAGAASAKEKDS